MKLITKNNKNGVFWLAPLALIIASTANAGEPKQQDCIQQADGEWVDRMQANTYSGLCKTVRWIDGLFGNDQQFDAGNFRGKLVLGTIKEEGESLDPKIRVRLKADLPNLSRRFNAFIGRVEGDEYIREDVIEADSLINKDNISRDNSEDASWLIGLGYNRFPDRGFSFSAGGKFSSGFQPYAKIKHRYLTSFESPHYLSFNQLAYIEKDDGYGFSSSFDYSYELSDHNLIRLGSGLKYTEELRQWEASTSLIWYHRLGDNRGFSIRGFGKDLEESPVSLPEYGLGITYRQPLHRDWLRLVVGLENRWVKNQPNQQRDTIAKLGVQVEMLFGKKSK